MNKNYAVSIVATLAITLASCGNGNKSQESVKNTDSIKEQTQTEQTTKNNVPNWDKILDDYDKFVTEYIKLYKKALKGDQTAISEYPKLLEQATKLSENLLNAQNNNLLTAKQVTRITEIANKMANAALESK